MAGIARVCPAWRNPWSKRSVDNFMPQFYIRNGLVVGQVTCTGGPGGGYRYLPFNSAHRASRKAWPTAEAAIKGRVSGGRLIEAASAAQAHIIAGSRKPEFKVGAYVPIQNKRPVLVPMLVDMSKPSPRIFVGPVVYKNDTLYDQLLRACDGSPEWMYGQNPVPL